MLGFSTHTFYAYYNLYLEFDGPNEKIRYHQSKLVIPDSETEYGFLRLHIPLYRNIPQNYQPGIIVA